MYKKDHYYIFRTALGGLVKNSNPTGYVYNRKFFWRILVYVTFPNVVVRMTYNTTKIKTESHNKYSCSYPVLEYVTLYEYVSSKKFLAMQYTTAVNVLSW